MSQTTTTTYSTPAIKSDQTTATPSHKVIFMTLKTVTKVMISDVWLNLEQVDTELDLLHEQLEMYTTLGDSQKQSETETEIDRLNDMRNGMQAALDAGGYTEEGGEQPK